MESQSMKLAKQDYRGEMESIRAFVSFHLSKTKNPDDRIKLGEVYNQFFSFCQDGGKKELNTNIEFKTGLPGLGNEIQNSAGDRNQICVFGVRVVTIEGRNYYFPECLFSEILPSTTEEGGFGKPSSPGLAYWKFWTMASKKLL